MGPGDRYHRSHHVPRPQSRPPGPRPVSIGPARGVSRATSVIPAVAESGPIPRSPGPPVTPIGVR